MYFRSRRSGGIGLATWASMRTAPSVPPPNASCVYGPVDSWRAGRSLGVDLLMVSSICSFNCVYCQLGEIQTPTLKRRVFVSTRRVLEDLERSDWRDADVVTVSGNGEPTLALNLGTVINLVRQRTKKPVTVLTNSTLLWDEGVQIDLREADNVWAKLDAVTNAGMERINRPLHGITAEPILEGIARFRTVYRGKLSLQVMLMECNLDQVGGLAEAIRSIRPDEVHLNTPRRARALKWHIDARGARGDLPYESTRLQPLDRERAEELEKTLAELTDVPILSVYAAR